MERDTTYEIIRWESWTDDSAEWLSGPLPPSGLDDEMNYLRGVYGDDAKLSYQASPIAREMAKAGRLLSFRQRG